MPLVAFLDGERIESYLAADERWDLVKSVAAAERSAIIDATAERGEPMSARDDENQSSREQTIRRIRSGIQAAQLRVDLDEARVRQTPDAVVRLAQRTPRRCRPHSIR